MLINMSEADIIEIHEDDGIFNEQEWIGIGKQECADLPNFVKAAREASRVVPDSVLKMGHLPGPDIMVADFVAWDVGRQFHPVLDITSRFHTVQFALLPSTSFLCLVDSKPKLLN